MNSVFIGLIFNFCASIAEYTDVDTLLFGYQTGGECHLQLELTGNNRDDPKSPVVNGHTITWQWLDGGVEVAIDGQRFVVLRFGAA